MLTALKLDTGFEDPTADINPDCNAGMEHDIRQANAPYFVKSPWLCGDLDEVMRGNPIVIDHAIIPVRDLYSAAESRRAVAGNAAQATCPDEAIGGLFHTRVPEKQESVLCQLLYNLFYEIAKYDIPVTLLYFPRMVYEPEYLYKKIGFLFPGIGYDAFLLCFREVSRPELVHDFKANSHAESPWMREGAPSEGQPLYPLGHTSDAVSPAAAKGVLPGLLQIVARWMGSKGEGKSGLRPKSRQRP